MHDAGTDVNVVALVVHMEEVRGGSALHYAVRKRYKKVIEQLASFGIDMNPKDQDGLTALDYTQSRGFMPFMAMQTPMYKDEAALLRELGATVLMPKDPVWPVLGPPQGSGRTSRRSASRSFMSRSTSTRAANQYRLERRRLLRAGAAALGAALLPSLLRRAHRAPRSRPPISAGSRCSRSRAATCSRCTATTAR